MIEKIKHLLKQKNAVLVAHYYVSGDLQDLAQETGGLVSDPPLFYRDADHKIWKILQSGNLHLTNKWHFHPIPIPFFLARGFLPSPYGFNDIITNDVSFFRQQFIEKIGQNLSC
jgi:hypothetical protein